MTRLVRTVTLIAASDKKSGKHKSDEHKQQAEHK